jgi:phosphopantothenoylcysteine decarboxylase/phosphopantothenate--cysteine ligase
MSARGRAGRETAAARVVVTAGPTREHLDDVRFLSNGSTGRLGIEIAREAAARGAQVTLVLGPTELAPPRGVRTLRVVSTRELLAATRRAARGADVVVFAAAPADWRPRRRLSGKPRKSARQGLLALVPTPDVAATLGAAKGRRLHVGFALEAGAGAEERAREKLRRKRFDAIVLNGPENLGRGGGRAFWIEGVKAPRALPTRPKARLARAVWERTSGLLAAGPVRR